MAIFVPLNPEYRRHLKKATYVDLMSRVWWDLIRAQMFEEAKKRGPSYG